MRTATQDPAWLADEEPFQPPLEDEPEDLKEEGEPHGPFDDDDIEEEEEDDIEEAGDIGEDNGGEIELDESTLLHKARQLEEIQEASDDVAAAQREYESARKAATARKADFEESVERLTRLIKASKESLPLFDRPKPATNNYAEAAEDLAKNIKDGGLFGGPSPTVEIPAADGWEGVQLSGIEGFPKKVAEKLIDEHGIFALGSLADWTASDNKLTDLNGIGPAKAEAAENALEAFWKSWNEKYPPYPPYRHEARDEGEAEASSP